MIEQWHAFQNIPFSILFYIGKNAHDNIQMISKSCSEDLWFHASDESSCHVIAKVHDTNLSKKQKMTIVKRGAQLCKQNTNKLSKQKQINVCYCYVNQLQINNESVGSVYINGITKNIIT